MSIKYDILGTYFGRDDDLVEFDINVREANDDDDEDDNLIVSKVRTEKLNIQHLKSILKQTQDLRYMREFYQIYACKMIQMELGAVWLYNYKVRSQLQQKTMIIDDLKLWDQRSNFLRWNELFPLNLLEHIEEGIRFYNYLLRERMYSIRICLNYKNNLKRKEFPFQYFLVFDLVDTIDFSISCLSAESNVELDSQPILLKMKYWQGIYRKSITDICRNILIPFTYYYQIEDELAVIVILAHMKKTKSQFDLGLYIPEYFDRLEQKSSNVISEEITDYLKMIGFTIQNSAITLNNVANNLAETRNNVNKQLISYVDLVEKLIFQTQPDEKLITQIFETIPNQLLGILLFYIDYKINEALDPTFILPSSEFVDQMRELGI